MSQTLLDKYIVATANYPTYITNTSMSNAPITFTVGQTVQDHLGYESVKISQLEAELEEAREDLADLIDAASVVYSKAGKRPSKAMKSLGELLEILCPSTIP